MAKKGDEKKAPKGMEHGSYEHHKSMSTPSSTQKYNGMQQAYGREMRSGARASLNETTDQRAARIKKKYPYGSLETGPKNKKF